MRRIFLCLLMIATGLAFFAEAAPEPVDWFAGDMHVHRSCGGAPVPVSTVYNAMVAEDLAVVSLLADSGNGEVLDPTTDLPLVTGQDAPESTPGRIIHWDAEWHWDAIFYQPVPHHALGGHVVMLGLTNAYQVWSEYTAPMFDLAHQQGGIAGFAHMQYLPGGFPDTLNCCTPLEYPVEVALGKCDFISQDVDGSDAAIEAYYRLLNCGFRPAFAGGSDYPCNADIGALRTYVQIPGAALTYQNWIDGIAAGRTVVSRNGKDEFLELKVNTNSIPGDEVFLTQAGTVEVEIIWTADASISGTIELVHNGQVVAAKQTSVSQGNPDTLTATVDIDASGWLCARRMGGGEHEVQSGAVFVTVDGNPVRASVEDALFYVDWMDELLTRTATNGVWEEYFITNRAEAHARYQAARDIYQQIADEAAVANPLTLTTTTLSAGSLDTPYAEALTAIGGVQPYIWSITNGTVPPGLSLTVTNGAITGSPTNEGIFNFVAQVADSAVPSSTVTQALSITITLQPTRVTIWPGTATPSVPVDPDTSATEVGVKFQSYEDGYITGLRFYKTPANPGPHVANLWTSGGANLATVVFANESASGWQEQALATGVAINSNTTYVASYHTAVGAYSSSPGYFAAGGSTNHPLRALADGEDGGNGIYTYSATSAFPDQTFSSENYWVDVVFEWTVGPDTNAPVVSAVSPTNNAIDVGIAATVQVQFNEAMDAGTITTNTFVLLDVLTNLVGATVSYDTNTFVATLTPDIPLVSLTAYTVSVTGGGGGVADIAGNASSTDFTSTFTTAAPDTTPPAVSFTSPDDGVSGVGIKETLLVRFGEAMDVASINTNTVYVRDSTNGAVAAALSYNPTTHTASLAPSSLLKAGESHTASVSGGTNGVLDLAGNGMVGDHVWSFTTVSSDPHGNGPGGPILLLTSPSNAFSTYCAEILSAEGLNLFEIADIATVSNSTLVNYEVTVLGDFALSPAQAGMLSNWVVDGGNLIAMRPDKMLAGLFGLSDAAATLDEGYILVNTASGPGEGITAETMQYHGTADLYSLSGATAVATLYTNAATASPHPAVTIRDVGTNGGQAAAFTYDLARSVVSTRQGNPAWADQDRDGDGLVRSGDLFFGDAVGDPQSDWVNLGKLGIPQADEQQRLLANLVLSMNMEQTPLPRFWYFPNGHRAALVMTGDDHANGYTADRFDQYLALSPTNASVEDWEAVRASSYLYHNTPLSDGQVAAYAADGFEVGLHINTDCSAYTLASLDLEIADQINLFKASYPSLSSPVTHRVHCIAWSGYTIMPEGEFRYGIRFDVNYYHFPASWLGGVQGFMTGSGMPMRFSTSTGDIINVYQAATQMTDESGQSYPATSDYLLDRALGPEGYYGAFVANIHTDEASTDDESDAIIFSCLDRGVPVVSAEQMLTWVDGRNNSSIASLDWTNNVLTFSVGADSRARGLDIMVPVRTGYRVSNVNSNGNPVTYQPRHVKGMQYVEFLVGDGVFEVSMIPDAQAPSVVTTTPLQAETGVALSAPLCVTFDEAIDSATLTTNTLWLVDSSSNLVEAVVLYNSHSLEAILTPIAPFIESETYMVTVLGGGAGVKDLVGNALPSDHQWVFTTTAEQPKTIWPSTATPALLTDPDTNPTEVGVRFQADRDGYILGIRFYKGPLNSGVHQGNLWTGGGASLATVMFSDETATGWQEQLFAVPVAVTSNTTYVASYHAPNGKYSTSQGYFVSGGHNNPPLRALANGEDGSNGIYRYGASAFPDQSFNSENYWVDVLFSETVNTNAVPIFVGTPLNIVVLEMSSFVVTNSATDAEAPPQVLSYQLVNPPVGASIDASGVISWTPQEHQGPSTNSFTTIASDGLASITNTFLVTVTETNATPVFDVAPVDVEIVELTLLSVTNAASDIDVPAQDLIYTLLVGPTNAAVDTNGVISWTPLEHQGPGTNTFTTTASDGLASITNSFVVTVTVTETNATPVFDTAPVDVEIVELTLLSVTNSASDVDVPVQNLTYTLISGPTNAAVDTNGVISWTPLEHQGPSTNTFTTTASDGLVSITNSFLVTVTETNATPVFDTAPVDVEIVELTLLSVTNSASDVDVPVQNLTYTLLSGPTNALVDSNGVISWTPGISQGPSTNTFVTTVSDGMVSATNLFQVVVMNLGVSPTVTSVGLTNGVVNIIWTAIAGESYQVEYLDDLTTANWMLLSEIVAPGSLATATNVVSGVPQRFYRVRHVVE